MDWNTEPKAHIRKDLFEVSHEFSVTTNQPTVSKCALMMPADTCLCVEAGLKQGRFNKDTFIIAVERDKETTFKIAENLKKLGIEKYAIINQDFYKLEKSFGFIENYCPEIDFAYLDLCGLYCNQVEYSFDKLYVNNILKLNIPVAYTAQLTDRVNMWANEDCTNHYKFSTIEKVQANARKLTRHFLDNIVNHWNYDKYIVTYGRAYKNSTSRCSPMVTFMTQPQLNVKYPKRHSGNAPYNMGYK